MKLSMRMLERWLQDLAPISEIVNNNRSILGVRLFENDSPYNPDFVYVGKTKDFFVSSSSDEVMIIFQNDIISVSSDDLNHVLNLTLQAFDYYSYLEQTLHTAIFQQDPEQKIISACETLIGPTFIMQPDFKILACSQNYTHQNVNIFWDQFVIHGEAALDTIGPMLSSRINAVMQSNPDMVFFQEPAASPYQYGLANTYYDYNGSVTGYLIIANNKPLTEFDKDIADVIMKALEKVSQRKALQLITPNESVRGDYLFSQLLENKEVIRTSAYLKTVYRLTDHEQYRLISFGTSNDTDLMNAQNLLTRLFPFGITCRKTHQILLLEWKNISRKELIRNLKKLEYIPQCRIAVSNCFHDISSCFYVYSQLEYLMSRYQSFITFFEDHAIQFLLRNSDESVLLAARHPIVHMLEIIDQSTHGELCKTLLEYLLNERSVNRTAQKLFVHKNTIVYRIDKIKSLELADFENADERQYIILSLLLHTS